MCVFNDKNNNGHVVVFVAGSIVCAIIYIDNIFVILLYMDSIYIFTWIKRTAKNKVRNTYVVLLPTSLFNMTYSLLHDSPCSKVFSSFFNVYWLVDSLFEDSRESWLIKLVSLAYQAGLLYALVILDISQKFSSDDIVWHLVTREKRVSVLHQVLPSGGHLRNLIRQKNSATSFNLYELL